MRTGALMGLAGIVGFVIGCFMLPLDVGLTQWGAGIAVTLVLFGFGTLIGDDCL